MFRRPHHQAIARILEMFNLGLLQEAKCFFAGGSAISLLLDEYRESVDIDFLCADKHGYRLLRKTVFDQGLEGLFSEQPKILRETRADQYGIRNFVQAEGYEKPIKLEIVFEARIELSGAYEAALKVPVLCVCDRYATKLIANADRYADPAAMSRDIIDLAMMTMHWGATPEPALEKARDAYGSIIDAALEKAIKKISDRKYLAKCLANMQMPLGLIDDIYSVFHLEDKQADEAEPGAE